MNSHHFEDELGLPAGGHTYGTGFSISWQRGPLGRADQRTKPNGAFVEDIIKAAEDRLGHCQRTNFKCDENDQAIIHLQRALYYLNQRTEDRTRRGVEGTHAP